MNTGHYNPQSETLALAKIIDPSGLDIDLVADLHKVRASTLSYLPQEKSLLDLIFEVQSSVFAD